jgi:hypothetical protein
MKKLGLATLLVAGLAMVAFGIYAVAGPGKKHLKADMLTGYQEATPAGVSTMASGTFKVDVDDATQTISFELTYSNLSTPATQAHIHFGNRYDSGGVSAFLCGPQPAAGDKGLCPAGNTSDVVTVTGTIDPADVIGPSAQGIDPGEWQELVEAMRAGVTYANVHTTKFPQGEIRAQINNENQRQPG